AVVVDDAVRHLDTEVPLGLEHRDPEPPLEDDLVLRRPDPGEVVPGVPAREHVGDRHCWLALNAMSVRCWAPSKSTAATPAYAVRRAADRSAPVPTTASTRPPAVTRSSPTFAVPAWMTCTPSSASAPAMPVITS